MEHTSTSVEQLYTLHTVVFVLTCVMIFSLKSLWQTPAIVVTDRVPNTWVLGSLEKMADFIIQNSKMDRQIFYPFGNIKMNEYPISVTISSRVCSEKNVVHV